MSWPMLMMVIGSGFTAVGVRSVLGSTDRLAASGVSVFVVVSVLSPTVATGLRYYFLIVAALVFLASVAKASSSIEGSLGEVNFQVRSAAVLASILCVYVAVVEVFRIGSISSVVALLLVASLFFGGSLLTKERTGLRAIPIEGAAAIGLGVAMLMGFLSNSSWQVCRPDKCSLFGELYAGPFESENTIGLVAVWATVFCGVSLRGRLRTAVIIGGLTVVIASGSRTAMLAGFVALGISSVMAFTASRENGVFRVRSTVAIGVPIATAVTAMTLIAVSDVETLSFRGRRWEAIREALGLSSIFGRGSSGWVRIQFSIDAGDTFPHSTFALLYVYGGLIAVGLLTVFFARLLSRQQEQRRADLMGRLVPAVVFVIASLVETLWNPAAVDSNLWALLLVTLWMDAGRSGVQSVRVDRPTSESSGARFTDIGSPTEDLASRGIRVQRRIVR